MIVKIKLRNRNPKELMCSSCSVSETASKLILDFPGLTSVSFNLDELEYYIIHDNLNEE